MAHFSRPLKWIELLDLEMYDIYLASNPKFKILSPKEGVTFIDITCLDDVQFSEDVRQAVPFYDPYTFEKHIDEDIRVMNLVQPDVVIGDFRHSLSVSCRLKKIKYINITNAYWSPDISMHYPLPESPIIRRLGERCAGWLLGPLIPLAVKFNFFKMAFALRKSFRRVGLFFWDYRQVITDGDVTLFCETPALVPLKKKQDRENFVGPFVWSMPVPLPDWWSQLDPTRKRIFLTLGSSGPAESLPMIISQLSKLNVEVIVTLAGKQFEIPAYANVHITNYLPIKEACESSDLIICNGGSPLCHAALSYGVPTIGIVCNNDQLLNMVHIQLRGAGRMLRYWNLTEEKITDMVNEVLRNPVYTQNAKSIQTEFDSIDVPLRLKNVLEDSF